MAEEESIENRVESLFTGEADEQTQESEETTEETVEESVEEPTAESTEETTEESTEETEEPATHEIEIDGTLYEVPAALKDAVLRHKDYTQKTQDVADQRKSLEVAIGYIDLQQKQFNFAQSIWDDVKNVEVFKATVDQYKQYLRDNIDSLSSTDIERVRFEIDETRQKTEELTQSITAKQQESQQALEQSKVELQKQGTEVLQQRIPGWNEDLQTKVRDYAVSRGYSVIQLESATPEDVQTLYESMQYRALQAGKTAAVKKVIETPSIKPKPRNPMPESVKNKLNLRKILKNPKLSSKAKARSIQESLGDIFG